MNYRLLIRKQAKADLQWASRWYERQSPGLGQMFVAEIDATLIRIEDSPLQYQTVYRDVRRAIPRKFPYSDDTIKSPPFIKMREK